jgi:hypothetical protein
VLHTSFDLFQLFFSVIIIIFCAGEGKNLPGAQPPSGAG